MVIQLLIDGSEQRGRTISTNTTEPRTKKCVQKNDVSLKDKVKNWNNNEILIYVCINARE